MVSLTIDSHTPPFHGLKGVLNFHIIFGDDRSLQILRYPNFSRASPGSLSAPMKFDPLLLNISLGFPLRATKCLKVREKTFVVQSEVNSISTARTVKYIKITPYHFAIA